MKKTNNLLLFKIGNKREKRYLFQRNRYKTWTVGTFIVFLFASLCIASADIQYLTSMEDPELINRDLSLECSNEPLVTDPEYDYCGMLKDLLADSTHVFTSRQVNDLKICLYEELGVEVTILDHNSTGSRSASREKSDVYVGFFYFIDDYSDPNDPKLVLRAFYSNGSKNTSIFEEVAIHYPYIDDPAIQITGIIDGVGNVVNGNTYTFNCNISSPRNIYFHFQGLVPGDLPSNDLEANTVLSFRVKLNNNDSSYTYRSPDETWTVTGEPFDPSESMCAGTYGVSSGMVAATADVHILYASADKILRKPLIFTDGLDLGTNVVFDKDYDYQSIRHGSLGWDTFITGLFENEFDEDPLALSPRMINELQQAGYDVLFVDFHDGATWIQANGECLIAILEKVNDEKGGNSENIVVGPSMGGQIARWALTTMEKREINHCTSSYVSFDSPQKGANIPLTIQALAYHLSRYDSDGGTALWQGLNRPAPQQLLVAHLNYMFGEHNGCIRSNYEREMEELGYPKQTSNVAIACASGVGFPVAGVNPANLKMLLFDAKVTIGGCQFMQLRMSSDGGRESDYFINGECNNPDRYETIFFGKLPFVSTTFNPVPSSFSFLELTRSGNSYTVKYRVNSSLGSWIVDETNTFTTNLNLDHWDTAPGCFRTDLGGTVQRQVRSTDKRAEISGTPANTTFMPVVSLLDINTTDLYYPVSQRLVVGANTNKTISPFDLVYYTNGVNLEHVQITDEIIGFVTGNILETTVAPSVLNTRYNYAHPSQTRVPSTTVQSGGLLVVNGDGRAGFDNIVVPSKLNHFSLRTGGCGGGLLDVMNNGTIRLAELVEFKATLSVGKGHKVHIRDGGTLELNHESVLIIEEGAELILDEGANIKLNDNSRIELKGKLIINGHVKPLSSGPIVIHETGVIEGNGHLDIRGQFGSIPSEAKKILVLEDDVIAEIDPVSISLSNGSVTLKPGSYIHFKGSGDLNLSGIRLHPVKENGLNIADYSDERAAISYTGNGHISINSSLIQNFYQGVNMSPYQIGEDITFEDTRFDRCLYGIFAAGIKDLYLKGVIIENGFGFLNGEFNAELGRSAYGIRLVGTNLIGENLRVTDYPLGTGILAPSSIASIKNNIWLSKCSLIKSCNIGIYLDGGVSDNGSQKDWGLLHLSGVTIRDNKQAGVKGQDILLHIDAINNPGHHSNVFLPCSEPSGFTTDPDKCLVFDICYEQRPDLEIAMRGNYWGPLVPVGGGGYLPLGIDHSRIRRTSSNLICASPLDLLYEPYIKSSKLLVHCAAETDEDPKEYFDPDIHDEGDGINYEDPNLCIMDPGSITSTDKFFNSYDLWKQGDKSSAMPGWEALATRVGPNAMDCKYYTDYAMVMTPLRRTGIYLQSPQINEVQAEAMNETISIYPNPVNNHVNIRGLSDFPWSYQITDISGRVQLSGEAMTGENTVNITSLAPGIYFISIIEYLESKQHRETFKMIKHQ